MIIVASQKEIEELPKSVRQKASLIVSVEPELICQVVKDRDGPLGPLSMISAGSLVRSRIGAMKQKRMEKA